MSTVKQQKNRKKTLEATKKTRFGLKIKSEFFLSKTATNSTIALKNTVYFLTCREQHRKLFYHRQKCFFSQFFHFFFRQKKITKTTHPKKVNLNFTSERYCMSIFIFNTNSTIVLRLEFQRIPQLRLNITAR